ncbi:IS1595 family transposase ISSpps1 [Sutcliffiella rhizosphaerae]|uniref:IS1595 family transposase ISSpps1 n=1 Tax=Sutcliffiella rhizosphaerae TaxID=2880967 RepID=A0ABN8AHG9_9BACI|nr:IS1595 family transposase ISSpps1 [Sutcliffiella rhizosphaerae]
MRIIFIFLLLFTIGCTKVVKESEEILLENHSVETLTINGQSFEIIPVYDRYLDYVLDVEKEDADRNESFLEHVFLSFSEEIYGHSYYEQDEFYFATPRNISKLKETIKLLDEKIPELLISIQKVLENATFLLPGEHYPIYIQPYNPDFNSYEMSGIVGITMPNGAIVLQIDPRTFQEDLFMYMVAHEYHHAVYIDKSDWRFRKSDLLNDVIMEGKSDTFATLMFPETLVPWLAPLSDKEKEIVLEYVREHHNSFDYNNTYILFIGSRTQGIPRWSNYKIGFHMVDEYLKKYPDLAIEEWTVVNAKEIFEQWKSE